jgi:PTS system nitrogen regulatory IIA component
MGLFSKSKKTESSSKTVKNGVSDFLSEKSISFFSAGPSKRQLFGNLIGLLDLPDPGEALKAILAREEAGSTVIAPGIALPHARIQGISGIKAALGLIPEGYESRTDGTRIHVILLFLGPADNMREHLAFLAGVSALFQQDGLAESLLKLKTPKAVLDRLRAAEKAL